MNPYQQNGSPLQQNVPQNQLVMNPLQQTGSSRIDKGGRANYMDSTIGKLSMQYILSYHNIDMTSGTYHGQLSLSQKTRCVASILWSRFVQWAGGLRRAPGPGACTQDLVCPGQICCKVQWTPFNQLFLQHILPKAWSSAVQCISRFFLLMCFDLWSVARWSLELEEESLTVRFDL